jgi:acyl-CoA reductase-like NAD-dependent aldehyde dehydrogenase
MLSQQKFDKFFFVGSTAVGRLIAIEAAKNLVPCLLELGGKCPVVVDADCHIETAAGKIAAAKATDRGQVCVCGDYLLVHESILLKFVDALTQRLK